MLEEFQKLFPLTVKVTKNLIKQADIGKTTNCIGARALKKGLRKKGESYLLNGVSWGVWDSDMCLIDGTPVLIEVYNENNKLLDMMDIIEPTIVTFKISKYESS